MSGRRRGDPWEEPTAKRWVRHVIDEMVPMLESSEAFMTLAPAKGQVDAKYCVELGAAIMLDKPIVVVVFGDRPVPRKLAAIADEVVVLPEGVNPDSADEPAAALARVFEERERRERG